MTSIAIAVANLTPGQRRRLATALERRRGMSLRPYPETVRVRLRTAWWALMNEMPPWYSDRATDARRAVLVEWLRNFGRRVPAQRGLPVFGPQHRLRHKSPQTRYGERRTPSPGPDLILLRSPSSKGGTTHAR